MTASKPRRSDRKKKGIPIPSFSCVSPSTTKAFPTKRNKKKTAKAPKWISSLDKAEGALHLSRVRSGPSKWSPDGLLRLDDFYALCRQLVLVETPKDGSRKDPDGLSLPERLLCDLITVSSPTLYRLVQNDDKEWCLELVDFKGNRLSTLCSLMNRPELDVATRDATLKTILEHRSMSEQKMSLKQETPSDTGTGTTQEEEKSPLAPQKVIQEPFIRDGMTLEDRIRARAQARKERENDASSKNKNSKQDYSSLLRLADAMWSHSKRNARRQSQIFQMSSAPFSMTVKGVVRMFAGSLVTSSSRTSQLYREKATRAEMLQALRDLKQLVPEWISFSSPQLSKDTTVWLDMTADFSSVRVKLGAPKSSQAKNKRPLNDQIKGVKAPPARVSLSPPIVDSATSHKDHTTTTPSPPKKQRRSPRLSILGRKRPVEDSLLSDLFDQPNTDETALSPPKKKRISPRLAILAGRKRPAQDSLESPTSKKKKGLRINPNFILTDADHNGGTILTPRIDESPRGLKRMFSQMNSGRRI